MLLLLWVFPHLFQRARKTWPHARLKEQKAIAGYLRQLAETLGHIMNIYNKMRVHH